MGSLGLFCRAVVWQELCQAALFHGNPGIVLSKLDTVGPLVSSFTDYLTPCAPCSVHS